MDEMQVDDGAGRQRRIPVDYPANSKKARQGPPEKDVRKIIEGEVRTRKKNWRDKLGESFLSEDSSTVASYVVMEVLVPALKNMVSDGVSQGIERILFGDSRPRSPARSGHTNYSRYSDRTETRRDISHKSRATHDFSDVIFDNRGEAEDVLDRLRDLISQFEVATVADLYDLVGLTGEFTDNKWGWYDLRSAGVRVIRGGYLLNLPRTQSIT